MDLLKLNLQFFAADGGSTGGGEPSGDSNNNGDNGKGDNGNTEPNNSGDKDPIPYDRFKQVNDNYKDMKTKYDELLQQQQQADEDAKKKQGEYETLYTELKEKHDPLSQEFTQYKETFQEILKGKLETVPENMRDLIPQGNELEQLKWIENATNKGLFKQDNPQSFGNGGTNPDTTSGDSKKDQQSFLKSLSKF
ncbi:hypothetical protein [Virgibacillus sp. CBA3643]|uniref:hypothetical protein n=1 Tax=Virgibacillus sp. CBA3643 TaxID=2942278 RepID=UPI0035A38D57